MVSHNVKHIYGHAADEQRGDNEDDAFHSSEPYQNAVHPLLELLLTGHCGKGGQQHGICIGPESQAI